MLFKFTHTVVGQCPLSNARQESQLMDQRLGAGTRVSQAWPVLRFQFKALTHLSASFCSRLFHEVGMPWAVLRLAVCLKQGAEERRRKRWKDVHFPNPGKLWEKYRRNCLQAQETGSRQHGFVKSKSCKTDLSFYSWVKGLGDGEKVTVLHLDFCLNVVPHDRQICSRINHYVIASKMACAWKLTY